MFTNDYIVLFLNNVKIKSNSKVKPTNPLVTEAAKESQGRHVLVDHTEAEKQPPSPWSLSALGRVQPTRSKQKRRHQEEAQIIVKD